MTNKEMIEKGLQVATQTKDFVMGHGVHTQVPVLFKKHFPGKKAMIIADCNTWKAAGLQQDESRRHRCRQVHH